MLFDRVIIKNVKSFGTDNNVLDVHNKITTIIGKNGSGKSNIIEALKIFKPFGKTTKDSLYKFQNLYTLADDIDIEIQLVFDSAEQESLKNKDRTYYKVDADGLWCFSGGLFNIVNEELAPLKTELSKLLNRNFFTNRDIAQSINFVLKETQHFNVSYLTAQKKYLLDNLRFLKDKDSFDIDLYKSLTEQIFEILDKYSKIVPTVFCFDDKVQLKDSFTLDDITKLSKNDINENNRFLEIVISAFGFDINRIAQAISTSTARQVRRSLEDSFNRTLKKDTATIFSSIGIIDTYLAFEFKENILKLYIYSNDVAMPFSERSSGLKWYLSLYSQMKKEDALDKKSLILIDEPGQSVHIEAQKGIRELFEKISTTSQIIYTTHSPFMIDTEDLSRLVLTEKVEGFSKIHNKVHSAVLEKSSKIETLSPLYQALGYSCSDNIGPCYDKLNIIVEGISDYYYFLGFMYYLGITKESFPNIIPSISVTNIHNVASILLGWGCKFKALLDYDTAGYNEFIKLKNLGLEQMQDIFTVNNKNFLEKAPAKENFRTIERVLTEEKYQDVQNNTKLLLAKEFYDSAKNGSLILSDDSKNNIVSLLRNFDIL
ncbi:MAG: AAA family ATPase [Clostridia bacterium]|nr:AAA family ATPase [Clostridia bacterium]